MGCERQMEQAGNPTGGGAEGNGVLLHTEEELLTEEFTQVEVLVGSLWLRERACGGRGQKSRRRKPHDRQGGEGVPGQAKALSADKRSPDSSSPSHLCDSGSIWTLMAQLVLVFFVYSSEDIRPGCLGSSRLDFEPWLCHLPALLVCTHHSPSLKLSFTYQLDMMSEPICVLFEGCF